MPQLSLPITAWSAWAPGLHNQQDWLDWSDGKRQAVHEGNPELHFVEPMLRRRLGRWARMAIHTAHQCLGEKSSASVVFASRHADLAKTFGMLEDLAEGEMLSPTAFSLSVNNASMGIFSILRQLQGQSTALSACSESFGYGLVEALSRLNAKPDEAVLYVYADDDPPEPYAGFCKDEGVSFPHAIALLLDPGAPPAVQMNVAPMFGAAGRTRPQSLEFMRTLCGKGEQTESLDGRRWTWSRQP